MSDYERAKFKIGDLVYYRPTSENYYANGTKQLGIVVAIIKDYSPLFLNFPESKLFEYEYRIKWISSGYTSSLLGFNLEKLEINDKK